MNTIESTKKWQEDEALRRFRLISPILDESLDPAKRLQVRKAIAEKAGVTTRSLYRYEAAYRSSGFAGLKPMNREQRRSFALPDNFDELVAFIRLGKMARKAMLRKVEIFVLHSFIYSTKCRYPSCASSTRGIIA